MQLVSPPAGDIVKSLLMSPEEAAFAAAKEAQVRNSRLPPHLQQPPKQRVSCPQIILFPVRLFTASMIITVAGAEYNTKG